MKTAKQVLGQLLSARGARIKGSPTLGIAAKAAALKGQGFRVYDFSAGQPHMMTPDHVRGKLSEVLATPQAWRYTPDVGFPTLRGVVAAQLALETGVRVETQNVVITGGCKSALALFFQAVLNPGDEVVVFTPFWPSYLEQVDQCDGKVVVVKTTVEDGFAPQAEALASALTVRTKVVVINSPGNPSGSVIPRARLEALLRVVAQAGHPIFVLSDEIYQHLTFPDTEKCVSPATIAHDLELDVPVAIASGWSKDYAMPGARLGFLAGPVELIKAVGNLQGNAPAPIQLAALVAYQDGLEFPKSLAAYYAENAKMVGGWVKDESRLSLPVPPHGAFYCLFDASACLGKTYVLRESRADGTDRVPIDTVERLAELLLEDVRVVLIPGVHFGVPNFLRMSVACDRPELEAGLTVLHEALQRVM